MKKILTVLFVLLITFVMVGCAPTGGDCPTPTDVPVSTVTDVPPVSTPTDVELDPMTWWEHPTTRTWPKELSGIKVAYLKVTGNVLLRREYSNNGDSRVFLISTFKGLRPDQNTIVSQRVEAKAGKIIMIIANPSQIPGEGAGVYRDVPFSDYARPFKGDGGNHAFWIMSENIIDGIYIGDHPQSPLFLPLAVGGQYIVEPFYPDW